LRKFIFHYLINKSHHLLVHSTTPTSLVHHRTRLRKLLFIWQLISMWILLSPVYFKLILLILWCNYDHLWSVYILCLASYKLVVNPLIFYFILPYLWGRIGVLVLRKLMYWRNVKLFYPWSDIVPMKGCVCNRVCCCIDWYCCRCASHLFITLILMVSVM
jgi:hypothetical protein